MADLSQFAGPLGGLLAITWGGGAMMGYAFANRTNAKRITDLRADMERADVHCREQIVDLTNRLREIEDRSYHGMERQASQQRQSAAFLVERGEIKAQRPEDEAKLP